VKLKTDKDVKEITIKHLRTELETKSHLIRRQNDELASLRDSVLELQR
jgi:DNA repair photolyase